MNTVSRSHEAELINAASVLQEQLGRRRREIDEARRLLDKIIVKLSKEKFKLVTAERLYSNLKDEKKLSNQRLNEQIEALRKEIAFLNRTLETKERED